MAKVNICNSDFEEIETNITNAKDAMTSLMDDVWQVHFENLYYNFIGNGFLDKLYKDSESKFGLLFGGGSLICIAGGAAGAYCAGTAAASLISAASISAAIPYIGWVVAGILAIIAGIIGLVSVIKRAQDVTFKYTSKEAFEELLTECVEGTQVNYLSQANIETKLENARLSLQSMLLLVAQFNADWADMSDAAEAVGLGDKVQYAADGLTITDIQTSVTIDGQEVEASISEALNAFYTYTATVTAAEIEAAYLKEKYPDIEIDFTDIVKRANGFMTHTLESELYSKEFVDQLLPEFSSTDSEAKEAVTGQSGGLGLDGLETLLGQAGSLLGDIGLYAGLIGTTFIHPTGDPAWPTELSNETPVDPDPDDPTPTDPTPSDPSNPSGPGYSGPGYSDPGSSDPGSSDPGTSDPGTEDPGTGNTVEIEPITETEVPEEELPFDYGTGDTTDYDKLAREMYEFGEGAEEIVKHQQELLDEIEAAYESGNLDGLREKLKEYGFSGPEIDAILADKMQCIKTMLYCDKREILAAKAKELAAADGITDYDTKYDDRVDYDSELSGDGPNDLLMLASEDESCVEAYKAMNTAKEAYEAALKEANPYITKANENKKAMEEIKAKYEKEFSSSDTTKWSEEAAKEYNEAIKTYNTSVADAAAQMATVEAAKTSYHEARTAFETAENNYYEKIKTESANADNGDNGGNNGDNGDNGGNDGNNNDNNDNNGGSQNITELHTDNVSFDENGDISFNFDNGSVAGVSLSPGVTSSTGATTNVPSGSADGLDGVVISGDSLEIH